jgi:glycosidase
MKKIVIGILLIVIVSCSCPGIQAQIELPVPNDLRRERIYSIILSRFFDADEANNFYNREHIEKGDPHFRGDLKGAAEQLSYISGLGFTAVCVTPPVENRGGLDFMGFNAYDFSQTDPRLKSEDFSWQDFIDEAHRHNLKVFQTLVLNHTCNYGIRNEFFVPRLPLKFYRGDMKPEWPYVFNFGNYKHKYRMDNDNPCAPEWFKAYLYRDQWGAGPLVDQVTGETFPEYNLHPERFFDTDETTLDSELYHTYGWLSDESSVTQFIVQNQHLDKNSLDLASENWRVKNIFIELGNRYIDRGVDGFRIQFARNMNRDDLRHITDAWLQRRPDLMIIADVAPVQSGFGVLYDEQEPSQLVPWWYTRTTKYPLSPDFGEASKINVFDYGLFKTFSTSITQGMYQGLDDLLAKDWVYADSNSLVTFFHNYDLGPEPGNLTRFSSDEWKAACAYNLMWTIRGVPCLLQGEEIAFQKGMPQTLVLPEDKLSMTGKAYFGGHLESDQIANTQSHELFKQIKRLNQFREKIPALSLGLMENGSEFVSGMSFVRNWNNGESYAVIGLSAFIDQEITVERILPGNYIDAVTGNAQTVATSTRSITFEVKGSSAGIWVLNGPGKIGSDNAYLR